MLSHATYFDKAGAQWTVRQSGTVGEGSMVPGGPLPPDTTAVLIFRRLDDGQERIVSVHSLEWNDPDILAQAFIDSTEVRG